MKRVILLFFSLTLGIAYGQFLEESIYLVDSLSKSEVSDADIIHLDSLTTKFRKSGSLKNKLDAIDKILENSPNNHIINRYSNFLFEFTSEQLVEDGLSAKSKKMLIQYKGTAFNYLGLYQGRIGNRKLALKYYFKSLALFKSADFKVGMGYAYNNLGADFYRRGDLDSALYYYRKGLKVNIELDEKMGVASLQYNMAAILEGQGKIVQSIDLYHEALKTFEEIENPAGIAYTLNNIAAISFVLNDYEKTIEYLSRSLEILKKIEDKAGVSYCLNNLGAAYREKGQLDKALKLLNESLNMRRQLGRKVGIIDCLNNIAMIHSMKNEKELAYSTLTEALAICREVDDQEEFANTLKNLGGLDIENGNWRLAKSRLDSALVIGREIESMLIVKESAKYLVKIASHNKDWATAFEMQSLYHNLQDSTRNDEARNAVVLGEMSYNHEKELFADSLQFAEQKRIDNLEHTESIKQAKIYTVFGVIGTILMLILVLVLYISYKRKKEGNILLREKNEENELLLGEIHHRVKNNLQVISSLLALQERSITDKKAKAAITEGRERVQSIGLIHKHLYQNNQFASIEMRGYVTHLVEGLVETLGQKSNPIAVKVDIDELHLDVDTAVPLGLLINELVVNALKHAYSDVSEPLLKISLKVQDGTTTWEVIDNGVGKKADLEQANSFGMKLIRSLSRQLGATIHIQENDGLSFGITLKTE